MNVISRHVYSLLFLTTPPPCKLIVILQLAARLLNRCIYASTLYTSYVVSNLSLPRTTCRSRRSRPLSFAPCAPCLVSLPCGCSLTSGEIQLAGPPVCTNLTTSTSVLHAVNLIVLQHFYDLDNVNLSGSTLLPPTNLPPLLPLRLPLFSENASRLLAADESLDYSLRKLANSLANDSVVLHSPSEAILYDYIRTVATRQHRFPNFSEISTWLTLLPYPCIIYLCISHFLLLRRFQALQLLITASAVMPRVSAFQLRTAATFLRPPVTPPYFHQWFENVQHVDILSIISLVILFICMVYLPHIYATYCALPRRTYIYLDFSTANALLQLHYYTLASATRCYEVKIPTAPTILVFRSYFFFGVLSFKSKLWCLHNTLTNRQTPLPAIILIPPWLIKRVQKIILMHNYKVYPLIVHSHEYNYYHPPRSHSSSPLPSVSDEAEDAV